MSKTAIIQPLSSIELNSIGAVDQTRTMWIVSKKADISAPSSEIIGSYLSGDKYLYRYIIEKSIPKGSTYYWFYKRVFIDNAGTEFEDPNGWSDPHPISSTDWDLMSHTLRPPINLEKPMFVNIEMEKLIDPSERYFSVKVSALREIEEGHLSTSWVLQNPMSGEVIFSDLRSDKLLEYTFDKKKFDIDDIFPMDMVEIVVFQSTETMSTDSLKKTVELKSTGIVLESNITALSTRTDKIVKFNVGASIKKISLINPATGRVIDTKIGEDIAGNSIRITSNILSSFHTITIRVYSNDVLWSDFTLTTTFSEQLFEVSKNFKYENSLDFLGSTVDLQMYDMYTEELYDGRILFVDRNTNNFYTARLSRTNGQFYDLTLALILKEEELANISRVSSIINIDNNSFVVEFVDKDGLVHLNHIKYGGVSFIEKNKIVRSGENINSVGTYNKITRGPGSPCVYFVREMLTGTRDIVRWNINGGNIEIIKPLIDNDLNSSGLSIAMVDESSLLVVNSSTGKGNVTVFHVNMENGLTQHVTNMDFEKYENKTFHSVLRRDGKIVLFTQDTADVHVYDPVVGKLNYVEIIEELRENLPTVIRFNNGSIGRTGNEDNSSFYLYT